MRTVVAQVLPMIALSLASFSHYLLKHTGCFSISLENKPYEARNGRFLTKFAQKKMGKGVSQFAPFFLLENVNILNFCDAKRYFSRCYGVFCVFRVHHFHHFSPFSSLTHLHLLTVSFSLLFSSLHLLSVVFCCLCCVSVLCCCRPFSLFCVVAASAALLSLLLPSVLVLLLPPVSAVVATRAVAAVAACGSCVFLSGRFSFLGNFSV